MACSQQGLIHQSLGPGVKVRPGSACNTDPHPGTKCNRHLHSVQDSRLHACFTPFNPTAPTTLQGQHYTQVGGWPQRPAHPQAELKLSMCDVCALQLSASWLCMDKHGKDSCKVWYSSLSRENLDMFPGTYNCLHAAFMYLYLGGYRALITVFHSEINSA